MFHFQEVFLHHPFRLYCWPECLSCHLDSQEKIRGLVEQNNKREKPGPLMIMELPYLSWMAYLWSLHSFRGE